MTEINATLKDLKDMVEIPISSPPNSSIGTPTEISRMSWRMTVDYHKPNCSCHDRYGIFAKED